MAQTIQCPSCPRTLRLPESYHGRQVRCPDCGAEFEADLTRPVDVVDVIPVPPRAEQAPSHVQASPPRPLPPRPPRLEPDNEPIRPRPRRLARKRRNPWARVVVIVGCLLALVGGIGYLVMQSFPDRPPRPPAESVEQKRDDLRIAFAGGKAADTGPLAMELKPLFEGLTRAQNSRNAATMATYFDGAQLVEEMLAQNLLPSVGTLERFQIENWEAQHWAQSRVALNDGATWESFEIRRVRKSGDNFAVAVVVHKTRAGLHDKVRWWLSRRSGQWKVYDEEELRLGMRESALRGSIVSARLKGDAQPEDAVDTVYRAINAIIAHRLEEADQELLQADRLRQPPPVAALRLYARAWLRLEQHRPAETLEAVTGAARFHPGMPILDLYRGASLNSLGRYSEALKPLRAYLDLLGDESAVCVNLAVALQGLGRLPEAAAYYRRALDREPTNADAFRGLLDSLGPDDDRGDLGRRFAKFEKPRETFSVVADDLVQRRDAASLEELTRAMLKIDPEFVAAYLHVALAKTWSGKTDHAIEAFKTALAKEKDADKRGEYSQTFLSAMAAAGKATEAYAALPEPRQTFRVLAADLKKFDRHDELKPLVAAHEKRQPNDRLLPFYRGEIHVADEEYALAAKEFAAGLAKPPEPEVVASFRDSRVALAYDTGQALAALEGIGPRRETLRQLVNLCLWDGNYSQLQALLDAQNKVDADDPEALRGRLSLKLRRGDVAGGVALFKSALGKKLADAMREAIENAFFHEMEEAGRTVESYEAAPDARRAFRTLADKLSDEERPDDLRRLIEAHRRRQPDDIWLNYYEGHLLIDREAWDKAAAVLGEGLKNADEKEQASFRWGFLHALAKTGQSKRAYEGAKDRAAAFAQLAQQLADDGKAAELEALIEMHRPHAGDSPELPYYDGRAKVLLKEFDAAAALIRQAYDAQPQEFQRQDYLSQFVLAMEKAGRGLDGYRAAPNRNDAFETLAGHYLAKDEDAKLAALLAEHGKAHGNDPAFHYYSGERHLKRGELAQAEKAFVAARAKPDARRQWQYDQALMRTRTKLGKMVETYREFREQPDPLGRLANVCVTEKNAAQLEALLTAHRKESPDDRALPSWDLELRWLKQDYAGALRLLEEQREQFAKRRHRWKADDIRVRSLVKLKRAEEAVREAQALLDARRGEPLLLVLAHAAAGDVEKTLAALEKQRPTTGLIARCYNDPDLGPLLRGDKFQALREKYPERKEKEDR